MGGLDSFLAKSLENTIKKNLGMSSFRRVQSRLFEKYGISITEAMNEFEKIDEILKESFGGGAKGIKKKALQQICILRPPKNGKGRSVTVVDPYLIETILFNIGDPDKKNIMTATISTPKSAYDLLGEHKIPQTSGYRKIKELLNDGLLVVDHKEKNSDGKVVSKYLSVFSGLSLSMNKNKVSLNVTITKEAYLSSSIIQAVNQAARLKTLQR